MFCLNCNKRIIIKRSLSTLFKNEMILICDDCFKKNPINITYNEVELDNYKLKIYSLFENDVIVKYNPYLKEYSYLICKLLSDNILVFDSIIFNDETIQFVESVCKLLESNLVIVCFKYLL
ncbi:MAG: hypothetical protein ACRC5M_03340 [Anaeroplasmataceae bacterium]